jgi:hypothetical protein
MFDDLMNIQFKILLFTRFEINFQESKLWSVSKSEKRFEVQIWDLVTTSQHGDRRKYRIRYFHSQVTF